MESGAIADAQISASSAHDIGNVGPQHARYDVALNIYYLLLLLLIYVLLVGAPKKSSRGSIKFIARRGGTREGGRRAGIHVYMNNDAFSRSGRHFTDIKVMLASITLYMTTSRKAFYGEHFG